MTDDEAETELLKRYFTNFAPATVKDDSYYTGFTQAKIKELMKNLPLISFSAGGTDYFSCKDIPSNVPEIPQCILLSGFDQLMLGYKKEENPFLPKEYLRGIFNLSGIVMPSVLLNGKVVGKWKHKNGILTFDLFEALNETQKNIITEAASQLFEIKKTNFSS